MRRPLVRGSQNIDIVPLRVVNDTDGGGVDTLPGDFQLTYLRSDSVVEVTITTVTGILGQAIENGFVNYIDGIWVLGLPKAAKATGDWVIIRWVGTGVKTGTESLHTIQSADVNSTSGGLDVELFKANTPTVPTVQEIRIEMDANSTKLDTTLKTGQRYKHTQNAEDLTAKTADVTITKV